MKPFGIEPATFRLVAQHLNHCTTAVPDLDLQNNTLNMLAGLLSRYSDWLRVGRSGDQIPVWARFSAPVQTGLGALPASCTMGTGSFPGVKSGRGVTMTPHPLLVVWSRKSIAIPLLPLWAVRPVESLSACTVQLYLYSPFEPYGLYRASVPVQ